MSLLMSLCMCPVPRIDQGPSVKAVLALLGSDMHILYVIICKYCEIANYAFITGISGFTFVNDL